METNWDFCSKAILEDEGGWANRGPHDRGGKTNFGITLATFQTLRERHPLWNLPEHLQDLTQDQALKIYHDQFWQPSYASAAQGGVDLILFNIAVMSGIHRSIVILQQCLGLRTDGVWGPMTEDAQRMAARNSLAHRMNAAHLQFCRGIKDPGGWRDNGKGWTNRFRRNESRINELAPQ